MSEPVDLRPKCRTCGLRWQPPPGVHYTPCQKCRDYEVRRSSIRPAPGFGAVLRGFRKSRGETLAEFSQTVSLGQPYLSKLENDKVPIPPLLTMMHIAAVLGTDMDQLLDASGCIPQMVLDAYRETPDLFLAFTDLSPKQRVDAAKLFPPPGTACDGEGPCRCLACVAGGNTQ